MQDTIDDVEAVDNFSKLDEHAVWNETPPSVASRFYSVRRVLGIPLLVT